jgi:beta-N-acetylhexosaminidase
MRGASLSENNEKKPKPVIFGCAGTRLSALERAFFRSADPFGIILFKRNCESRDQVRGLIAEIRQAVGRDDVQIAVDQEGGRVSRLSWVKYPCARAFGLMYERDPEWGIEAIRLYARVLAFELVNLGFTINCVPVVDLYNPEGWPVIGDRAFSASPSIVAELARAQVETLLSNGILPVVKHLPGHGKLKTDPHEMLPTIDALRVELEGADFVPFELLKDVPLGMNSHAVFSALDQGNPASLSPVVNGDIIRGRLGFDGLLLSDDITMKALKGSVEELALRALEAGNDIVLHCSGDGQEMSAIAACLNPMSDVSWARWKHAAAMVAPRDPNYNIRDDAERLNVLLGGLAYDEAG